MRFSFLFPKEKCKVSATTDITVTPIKEKMLIRVQQDINREALIKLLDLEASVIARRSDDFYNSNNFNMGNS